MARRDVAAVMVRVIGSLLAVLAAASAVSAAPRGGYEETCQRDGESGDRGDGESDDREPIDPLRDDAELEVRLVEPTTLGPVARAPQIAAVLEAAYAAAGLDRDPARSWRRRARIAALLPWVTARTGWNARWNDEDPDIDRGRTIEVRATWRLDRLVFDGRELQVSSADVARRRERRRLASRVIAAYFHWRRVTAAAATSPRWTLAVEAATAELDALTDGWFSDRANSGR